MTIHGTNERSAEAPALMARPRARWSRSPNVLDRPTRQGVMVLPPEGAAVLLTGLAARVWDALAQPLAGDQLAERLAQSDAGTRAGAAAPGAAGPRAVRPAAGPGGGAVGGGDAGPTPEDVDAALGELRAIGAVREIR